MWQDPIGRPLCHQARFLSARRRSRRGGRLSLRRWAEEACACPKIRREYCLTLAGFEPRILLVDHVNATLAADDAAVLVTLLERPEGVANLHDTPSEPRPGGPKLNEIRPGRPSIEARKLWKALPPVNLRNGRSGRPWRRSQNRQKIQLFRQKAAEPVY